ncbi:MAG: PASTA domain-containing protein [Solirubrobacteraceae bacterium]
MSRRQPGWLGVALAASLAGLAGVLLTLALGGGPVREVETITVQTARPEDFALVARTAVPSVVGQPLVAARDRLEDAGFLVDVDGAGLVGLVLDRGWRVVAQTPRGRVVVPTGSTVHLTVARH